MFLLYAGDGVVEGEGNFGFEQGIIDIFWRDGERGGGIAVLGVADVCSHYGYDL